MTESMPWMDQQTKDWMEWDSIWQELRPRSSLGQAWKRQLSPFTKGEEEEWQRELELTRSLELLGANHRLEDCFVRLKDPQPFLTQLARGNCGVESDWFGLQQFLQHCYRLFQQLATIDPPIANALPVMNQLLGLQGWESSFSLGDTSEKLRQKRQDKQRLLQEIDLKWEHQRQQAATELGLPTLPDRQIFIPLQDKAMLERCAKSDKLRKVRETPFEYILTLLPSKEEVQLRENLEELEKQMIEEEHAALQALADRFQPYLDTISTWAVWVGQWDWRWTKWVWYKSNTCTWAEHHHDQLSIQEGVYLPLYQQLSRKQGEYSYTPLSVKLSYGLSTIVGSNMGGKSVVLKTIALLTALAHYALPVPAKQFHTPLFSKLISISGDQQSVEQEVSTFGAEMVRLSNAIEQENALLLMDELARGTNPFEGEALAVAVGQEIAVQHKQVAIMVTHFARVTSIKGASHLRVKGLQESGEMDFEVVSNHESILPRHATRMAERLGLPQRIIEEAERLLKERETDG